MNLEVEGTWILVVAPTLATLQLLYAAAQIGPRMLTERGFVHDWSMAPPALLGLLSALLAVFAALDWALFAGPGVWITASIALALLVTLPFLTSSAWRQEAVRLRSGSPVCLALYALNTIAFPAIVVWPL